MNEFVKDDTEKLQWHLMPFNTLESVVKVLMHGAEKYSPDNWKECDDTTRYKNALARHFMAYMNREYFDTDSGLPHLSHLVCNALFLLWINHYQVAPIGKEVF